MPPLSQDKNPLYETSISNLQVFHKTTLMTLKEIKLILDPLENIQLQNAANLNIRFGDERCRVFIDKKEQSNYIVFCLDENRGSFMKNIQLIFDENYAHNMRNIDIVNLPFLWQKENINIIYKNGDKTIEAFFNLLSNSFLIQSKKDSGFNIGGNLYQDIHNCEVQNSKEEVHNVENDCCFEFYLKYTKSVFNKQKQIICSNIQHSVDQCNLEKRQIMKELQLQCYYKKGQFDKVALALKKQSLDKLQMSVENFKQILNQPQPQSFYNKDFSYQAAQIQNKDDKQEKQEFFNHLITSNNERIQKKTIEKFYFKDDLMQKDKDIIMKAAELSIIGFKNMPGNSQKNVIQIKDLTQMATKILVLFRKDAIEKCNQEINLNLMQVYDISLSVNEILLTIYSIIEQLNEFAIIQESDSNSYELTQKYSKEQLEMNMQQIDDLFKKVARSKSTNDWKRQLTYNFAFQEFKKLYKEACKQPIFDPNFIKEIGKNMDQIISNIILDSNIKYKETVLNQTSQFMYETKNQIISQAEKVLLQPLSLKQKFEGMGLKKPEEASNLIGVNPSSNYNTIEIKSKLEMPQNFESVFGNQFEIPMSNEQKKIEFDKKAIQSTSLPLPGGTYNFDEFQMIKQNKDNYYTYINTFTGDKLEFFVQPNKSLDVQALSKKPLEYIQQNYQVINANLKKRTNFKFKFLKKQKNDNTTLIKDKYTKQIKQFRLAQIPFPPPYDLTIKDTSNSSYSKARCPSKHNQQVLFDIFHKNEKIPDDDPEPSSNNYKPKENGNAKGLLIAINDVERVKNNKQVQEMINEFKHNDFIKKEKERLEKAKKDEKKQKDLEKKEKLDEQRRETTIYIHDQNQTFDHSQHQHKQNISSRFVQKQNIDDFQAELSNDNQNDFKISYQDAPQETLQHKKQEVHQDKNDIDQIIQGKDVEIENENQDQKKQFKKDKILMEGKLDTKRRDDEDQLDYTITQENEIRKTLTKDDNKPVPPKNDPVVKQPPDENNKFQEEAKALAAELKAKQPVKEEPLKNGKCDTAIAYQSLTFNNDEKEKRQINLNNLNSLSQSNTINIVKDLVSNTTTKQINRNIVHNHYILAGKPEYAYYSGQRLLPKELLLKINLNNDCEVKSEIERHKKIYG